MAENIGPYVQVQVEQLTLRPGQTISVYVSNADGTKTQIEIRSVGVPGASVGIPEIFCDDGDIERQSFDGWKSMDQATRERYGFVRLGEPKPPQPKEE